MEEELQHRVVEQEDNMVAVEVHIQDYRLELELGVEIQVEVAIQLVVEL